MSAVKMKTTDFGISAIMAAVAAILAIVGPAARGELIAEYLFDSGDGSNTGTQGASYNLSTVGATPTFTAGIGGNTSLAYASDGDSANYLQLDPAYGGAAQFTVSVWVYTNDPTQTDNKGIFSNLTSSTENNSWQLAIGDGQYQFKAYNMGNDDTNLGTPSTGVWQNIVIQKYINNTGDIWVDGVKQATLNYNPGGLQKFRIGINRASDSSLTGYIDKVQIWLDENVSAADIYAAGVPEPASVALLALGGAAMLWRPRA